MAERKKFRDTKAGQWFAENAPKVVDIAGDLLPDRGALGIVKRLIDNDDNLTAEEKAQAHAQLVELYELEVADRDSARRRESTIAKFRKVDFMFIITGLVGLGAFIFIVYAISYLTIPEENYEMWIHLIGICEGVVISIFGYYYGSAVKQDKD